MAIVVGGVGSVWGLAAAAVAADTVDVGAFDVLMDSRLGSGVGLGADMSL